MCQDNIFSKGSIKQDVSFCKTLAIHAKCNLSHGDNNKGCNNNRWTKYHPKGLSALIVNTTKMKLNLHMFPHE